METGGGAVPFWVNVLAMSKEWSTPPWEIEGEDTEFTRWLWAKRWAFFGEQLAKKQARELTRINR